ncbi:MAG: hypothetical protein ACJATV_001227 [Granulosicoccus sp.]|jgi:hypothetical protein
MPAETMIGLGFQPTGKRVGSKKKLQRTADIDPRLTRSYYFDNRLLTEKDLNRDQIYLDGRLREVGQALGYGIMRGLAISFDALTGQIDVTPGIGVSTAGRVLELSRSLRFDLRDRAAIMQLNNGRNRRLERGLYVLVIQYTEYGTDVAEVFPSDLISNRDYDFDLISEGIKLSLVKLSLSLSQQNSLQVRANLMTKFYGDATAGGEIPEDAVALGVLAVDNDRPLWLDQELLRQPLRSNSQTSDTQADFYRQYQALFSDLMAYRASGSLNGDFSARDYFTLLPPVGSLPKDSISPITGRQSFFPEQYNVSIAPVRKGEVELLKRESMLLPSLNLVLAEAQDIMVLVPLSNTDYGHYAQRLQQPMNTATRKLSSSNLLRLRLYPKRPVHELDTDRSTWEAIWDTVAEEDLLFIRRPQRAAETRVSGIVLAQGVSLPAIPPAIIPTPADTSLLQDEDSVFLNRINIAGLIAMRGSDIALSIDAATALENEFAGQAEIAQQLLNICLRIERQYNDLLWPTLLAVARNDQLADFSSQLFSEQDAGILTAEVMSTIGVTFGLSPSLVNQWSDITA